MIKIDFKEFFHKTGIFGLTIWSDRVYSSRSSSPKFSWEETWWIGYKVGNTTMNYLFYTKKSMRDNKYNKDE